MPWFTGPESSAPDAVALLLLQEKNCATKPAVAENGRTMTYREFVLLVRRLAQTIVDTCPGERRVLIDLPQGFGAYAAMFAVLMAGGVYSPVNREWPVPRRARVLAHFNPTVVITETDDQDGTGAAVISINGNFSAPLAEPEPPHELAYVMFTSGSTGEPKGVAIGRDSLAHFIAWTRDAIAFAPGDRVAQHPNIAFDASVTDIYGALCAGAALYPLASGIDRLMPARAIHQHRLTVWNSVPSVIDLMLQAGQLDADHLGSLRLVNLVGEPLLAEQARAIRTACPGAVLQNTYGPTEATVSCTRFPIAPDWTPGAEPTVPLGDAIPGMHVLLDGNGPIGEIVLVGPQIARGYWGDPEATAHAFTTRRIDGRNLPAYRTGDLAERVGGNLYFRGRRDRQVKIKGYRLELAEIEQALRETVGRPCSVVVIRERLHAVIEGPPLTAATGDALRTRLEATLPTYAVPAAFHAIDRLPRNLNDKVDGMALVRWIGEEEKESL